MITYIPTVLVCAMSLSLTDCKQGKDQVITVMGEDQPTIMGCLKEGQEKLSKTAFAPREEDKEKYYYKVSCVVRK